MTQEQDVRVLTPEDVQEMMESMTTGFFPIVQEDKAMSTLPMSSIAMKTFSNVMDSLQQPTVDWGTVLASLSQLRAGMIIRESDAYSELFKSMEDESSNVHTLESVT